MSGINLLRASEWVLICPPTLFLLVSFALAAWAAAKLRPAARE